MSHLFRRFTPICLLLLATIAGPSLLRAQKVVETRVIGNPTGAVFMVDGVTYNQPQTFLWTEGSTHVLEVAIVDQTRDTVLGLNEGVRYLFSSWTESSGLFTLGGTRVVVQATPAITSYTATFTTQVLLKVKLADCSILDPTCVIPGSISLNQTVYTTSFQAWVDPTTVYLIQAYPNPGYAFTGYRTTIGNSTSVFVQLTPPTNLQLGTITIEPLFVKAHRVRINYSSKTEPYLRAGETGLKVFVDGGLTATPVIKDWAPGTKHILAAQPQQDGVGRWFAFGNWTFSSSTAVLSPAQITVEAGPASSALDDYEEIYANFVDGYAIGFGTNPPVGLKLLINGNPFPGYNPLVGIGTKVDIEAPLQQKGTNSRLYQFNSWTIGGDAKQTITVTPEMVNGQLIIARYDLLGRVSIKTDPVGLGVQVDGASCAVPCVIDKAQGTSVAIAVPQTSKPQADTRFEFVGWGDSDSATRSITLGEAAVELTARYRTAYKLNLAVTPPEAADLVVSPSNAEGFYPAGSAASVTAKPRQGWRFVRWRGDATGTGATQPLFFDKPLTLTAVLEKAPEVSETGVRNAAGETPALGVAPGSLITIFGSNLSTATASAGRNPVPQTLADTVVRINDFLLPLLYVSPSQINALVPTTLKDGDYDLFVQPAGQPPLRVAVSIVRNSPGLFSARRNDLDVSIALHADGSLVTLEKPATPGETIRVLGTGFGPFRSPIIDGFNVPASPQNLLLDGVELSFNDKKLTPDKVYATPNDVGLTTMELKIDDRFPKAATIAIKVTINGRVSNTVQLPLQ